MLIGVVIDRGADHIPCQLVLKPASVWIPRTRDAVGWVTLPIHLILGDLTGAMASADTLLVIGPDQVLALLRERQSEWQQRYQLQRIGLFGSMARNQATASSDVDVWVELDPHTPYATGHLKQELKEPLQRPVDLVPLREPMNPGLRQALLLEGISA